MSYTIQNKFHSFFQLPIFKYIEYFLVNYINIKELIIIFFSLITIICFVFHINIRWRSLINKISQHKIDIHKSTGKYIPDIFIELNNSKELLRYFLHGKKWKLKIINYFNLLKYSYIGKLLIKNTKLNIFIPFYANLNKIQKHIDDMKLFINNIRNKNFKECLKDDVGDLPYIIESLCYRYDDLILDTSKMLSMCNTNHVLFLGSAGNGKTNLLCNFSETVMKYGQPCIFIDAKEIKGKAAEYLYDIFNIPKLLFFKYIKLELFIRLYSIILFFKKKYIFFVIDALNENDNISFYDDIKSIFCILNKYNRIKIITSCRSEYFNDRFRKLFDNIYPQFTFFNINEAKYNSRAKEKALNCYQTFFNVKGNIIGSAKEKLFSSLLLMRIFFEVNKNKEVNTLELRNAEIYKLYVKQIANKFSESGFAIDFQKILDRIISYMMTNNLYDNVPIDALQLDSADLYKFKTMLDENLIINKTIKTGIGITEIEKEVVYFVFHELRDFCISRKILLECENKETIDYNQLFYFLNNLYENKLSPLEGVLKYSYYYLKNVSNNPVHIDVCKKIIKEYDDKIIYDEFEKHDIIFYDFLIIMIISDCSYLEEFELEYIIKSMKYIHDFWNMLIILLNNEIAGCGLTIELFIRILLGHEVNSIKMIINDMIDENDNDSSYILNTFCSSVLQQNYISNNIKWILIIMNEIGKFNQNIEKCIIKFNIGENDKNNFIEWLSRNESNNSYVEKIACLIKSGRRL